MNKQRFSFNWLKPAVLCLSAFLVVPGFLEDGTARADALEGRKVYEMHCIVVMATKEMAKALWPTTLL